MEMEIDPEATGLRCLNSRGDQGSEVPLQSKLKLKPESTGLATSQTGPDRGDNEDSRRR